MYRSNIHTKIVIKVLLHRDFDRHSCWVKIYNIFHFKNRVKIVDTFFVFKI